MPNKFHTGDYNLYIDINYNYYVDSIKTIFYFNSTITYNIN